ncbi:MAG: tRNA (adenine(22)-N(1))-methyltransferase TrmK [Streptococcus sp.]
MEFTKLSIAWTWWLASSQKERLLDVGSDHAYLPIALLQEGKIEVAIAGSGRGPYQSAVQNVADNGLDDKIEVRLANGLAL